MLFETQSKDKALTNVGFKRMWSQLYSKDKYTVIIRSLIKRKLCLMEIYVLNIGSKYYLDIIYMLVIVMF